MPERETSPRVAVYLDFDNIVISRYDSLFGDGSWRSDEARRHSMDDASTDPVDVRLAHGRVDIGAIIDYATSFGTVAFTRAYADWSLPANAAYRGQLVQRAVDLVQLFPVSGTKNGADIRLSIDAVDDLFRHPDLTHVVIVAGDSDYISLAQRCKMLGRYVVGIGVARGTSRALVAACDEFSEYALLPGVTAPVLEDVKPVKATRKRASKVAKPEKVEKPDDPQAHATDLLHRAIRVLLDKSDDEWIYSSGVKSQMQRLDPGFKEKPLGFSTFRQFVEAHQDTVESRVLSNGQLQLRVR